MSDIKTAEISLPVARTKPVAKPIRPRFDEYDQLTNKLFAATPFKVVLFASITTEEPVSQVVESLSKRLSRRGARFLAINADQETVLFSSEGPGELDDLLPALHSVAPARDGRISITVESLRAQYDFILVDCGSIVSSLHLAALIPSSDGVVIVLEDGRIPKERLIRVIEAVDADEGKLIGLVLTKYRDPLPSWLRRLLSFS